MELSYVSYEGPPLDDPDLLSLLPEELAGLLRQINGFVQFAGGLHVRGACRTPRWHSVRDAWLGEEAFSRLYPDTVRPEDVPFAEDCLGNQFLLRGGVVWQLSGETGEVQSLGMNLLAFLEQAQSDPVGFLFLEPLIRFSDEGGRLEPGRLLSVFPPYCMTTPGGDVSLRDVPADERRRFLADLAAQLRDVPDGSMVTFRPTP